MVRDWGTVGVWRDSGMRYKGSPSRGRKSNQRKWDLPTVVYGDVTNCPGKVTERSLLSVIQPGPLSCEAGNRPHLFVRFKAHAEVNEDQKMIGNGRP